ncbi:MAG: hypothetical protein ACYC6T_08105 [Thermoleophilia bacterium]
MRHRPQPRQPKKAQRKLIKRILATSKVLTMGWCAELDLNPELYRVGFDTWDWSRVWLVPIESGIATPESPSMGLQEAVDLAARVLPAYLALKALAGESVRKQELGLPEAWQ